MALSRVDNSGKSCFVLIEEKLTKEVAPEKKGLTVRIGVVSPDDGVNDDEYYHYLPAGVTLLWTRFRTPQRFDPISVEMVASYGALDLVREAALTLRITRPHVTLFACNSCSFVHGLEGDQKVRNVIAEAADCEATSVTEAEVEALRVLGVRRVAVGAPYSEEVTGKLVNYLRDCDFTVTGSACLGLTTEWQIGNSPPAVWDGLAKQVNTTKAEAVLLACSGIRTAAIMESLEKDLQKPVVSAPAASVWRCLRLAGLDSQVAGRGTLLDKY